MTKTAEQFLERQAPRVAVQPVFCSISNFEVISGLSRRSIYDEIGRGNLKAVKRGSSTLIDVEAGLAWLRSLPAAEIRAPRAPKQPEIA